MQGRHPPQLHLVPLRAFDQVLFTGFENENNFLKDVVNFLFRYHMFP